MSRSILYMVQAGENGPVKIGTTKNLPQRFAALQTANASELRLLAAIEATTDVEAAFHRRFDPHRLRGEWFSPVPDLLRTAESLPSGIPERLAAGLQTPACRRCWRALRLGPSGLCAACRARTPGDLA